MRVTCEVDGFDAWVDISPRFTRAQVTAYLEMDETAVIAMLRERMTACHVPLNDGTVIDDPAEFVAERLEEADVLILAWIGGIVLQVVGHQRTLGKASSRLSSGSNGVLTTSATTATT